MPFNPLIHGLAVRGEAGTVPGQERREAMTGGKLIQFMKSRLNLAVLSLVTEGNEMIDCCLLEGYNLVSRCNIPLQLISTLPALRRLLWLGNT